MPTEREQRQIDRLLDAAEEAALQLNWSLVRDRATTVLAYEPDNADALGHLRAAEAALDAAEQPPAVQRAGASGPPRPAPSELPESFADGRYQVKKLLGEGGKKRVYLAHDSTLDREVAFGLIKSEGLDETGRKRILGEAQAMGRLGAHPHIHTVFDLGDEAGDPYIVTELMASDVEIAIEEADDQRLSLERAVEIAGQVCLGLEFAHSKGIVHRDLKPGNVMLTADGTAKIGDFGLAMAADRSRLTQEGMMVGTVAYMPPEQAMGREVTAQADLYSLGAMLYEMVTGRPPFVGDDSVAIIGQHLNTPPVTPTWHNSEVPQGLEALILRLLEKDPGGRPATAADVREALESIDLTPREPGGETATHAGPDPAYRKAFVGREAEIKQLHTAFDQAMSGHGSLVMVVGEPGIGKTSLCEQLDTYATLRGGTTLIGHCYEEGSLSLPYLAFVEAMRSYVLAREPDDLKNDLGSGASDVARIVSEVRDRLQVEPSEASDPEQDRYRLMQSVTSFLTNAASVQPLVIVLEDLHDADPGTLDMLTHVSRNLSDARLMIVGTYRDVEVDRSHSLSGTLAELRRVANFSRIPLRGLTADEVQRMMTSIAGQDVPWSLSETVHRQTEGNSLFVQEVLRHLVEQGYLARGDGKERRDTPPEMGLPEGLKDVIGKRLSGLTDGCQSVLSVAAVIGREFPLQVLETVAGLTEEELYTALEEASGVGVVEERSAAGSGVGFRFAHAFYRQTLYEETFAPRRIRLHQQVGRALEKVHSARPEEHAAELTDHFAQSTEREDLEKALSYGEMAAERAMSVYAYGEAVRLLEQALQVQEVLDPDDKAKRCDLLLALGDAVIPAGEPLRAAETLAPEAFALADALDDAPRAFRASLLGLSGMQRHSGGITTSTPEYRQWVDRAVRFATPGSREQVIAENSLAGVSQIQGEWAEARTLMLRVRESAIALKDIPMQQRAIMRLLSRPYAPKHHAQTSQFVQEMTDLLAEQPSSPEAGSIFGWTYMAFGRRREAEEQWRLAAEAAERTGDPYHQRYSLGNDVTATFIDGRLDEAVSAAERLTSLGQEAGAELAGRVGTAILSFRPLVYLGRAHEILAALQVVFDRGRQIQLHGSMNEVICLAHMGRRKEAQDALLRTLNEHAIDADDDHTPGSFLLGLLEAAVLINDAETSELLAPKLAPFSGLTGLVYAETCPARHMGGAAKLLGKPEDARRYYLEAQEAAQKIRFRPEIALTRLELAELLLDHYPDERAEALEHLDFAIGELRDMKMQPALERALSRREILGA